MSRLNRSDISRVLYGSQTVNLIRKGRIQIYPAPEFTEVYLLDDNKMYSVQVTETGDYLLSDDYLVTDTSLYEYLPPYVVVDPDKSGQWILSTQSRHSDMSETTYFMSNSNYNVSNGTARVKVSVNGLYSISVLYGSYADRYYDYVNLWNLDYDASSAVRTTSTTYSPVNTYNRQSSSAPNYTYTYTLDGGEHFFWVTYGKDSSGNSNEDRGYIGIATSLLQDRTVNNVDVYYEIAPDDYFLSGGVYREKLVASDGSEPLPGNILQSSLSENAETIDVEGTMYEAFYYYVTIKGVQVKAREYVLGNIVSLIETHFLTGNSIAIGWDNIRHKWDNNYTFSVYFVRTGNYGYNDQRGITWNMGTGGLSPIELSPYRNGWFFDFHKPKNTTSNETIASVQGDDMEWRVEYYDISQSFNTIYRLDVNATPDHTMTLYNLDGTSVGSSSYMPSREGAANFLSSYDFYDGYYLVKLCAMQYIAIGRIVVRDENGTVIHDYMMTEDANASGNARYVLKDFVEGYSTACTYTGTLTELLTQKFRVRDLGIPEVEAHFLTGNTNAIGFQNLRHKWDNGYKISLYWIKTASYSEDMRGFCYDSAGTTQYSPLEICAYSNGWYLDFHSPTSTTSDSVSGGDFDFRTFASSLTASTNTIYRFDVQISPYSIKHNNTDGTNIQSFSSTNYGSVQSSYNFYDGYYLQSLFVMKAVAVGRFVIRDANDNIIHDYIMTDTGENGNSRYVLKDFIENYSIACTYTGTVTDVMTQNFTPAVL